MAQQSARWARDSRPYQLLPDEFPIDITFFSMVEGLGDITLQALVSRHRTKTTMAPHLQAILSQLGYSSKPMTPEEIRTNTFVGPDGLVRCSQTMMMWCLPELPHLVPDLMRCPIVESDLFQKAAWMGHGMGSLLSPPSTVMASCHKASVSKRTFGWKRSIRNWTTPTTCSISGTMASVRMSSTQALRLAKLTDRARFHM
ncbi:hypothetical protein QBC35DRAFT_488653 [Podospora australis]|uniref:Uncharacterized protein n=1 Tax=Podospora australis TaxID=1536484 RepID=A0AAN7AKW5_9PEZI|nr:hypothetical protein QBC35DRAFT_488653 [Podospora australis]